MEQGLVGDLKKGECMVPWYAEIAEWLPIVVLIGLLIARPDKIKKDGAILLVSGIAFILLMVSMIFSIPSEIVVSGTALSETSQSAIELAKKVAIESIPKSLQKRKYRIFVGGGLLDDSKNGVNVVKTNGMYRATVTLEVDQYALDGQN